ncbi:MAG TPA: ABC-F family ATP-binding cassette domain-containing protein [Spirochaetales bacterium]|nr:ABC-F family ATP-binding cassette domain-containing protein [Spirochaetales bacterium]HQK34755.1 ABC-F family ATP-binding cassette domain-containing protein [Spirochaetales bacterium]
MPFVQCTGLSHAFGARTIFNNASLYLKDGSRAALAGPNGAGKTTLMKILAGIFTPDSVELAVQKGTRIAYLPQSGIEFRGCTIYEAAETAYRDIEELIAKRDELGIRLEQKQYDETKLTLLLEEFNHLVETIDNSGYWRRKERIYDVLTGLGFTEKMINAHVHELSQGWQMRLGLAHVLLEFPDIMLLDEPTNYLDIEARTWLEQYLTKFQGGYLIVSHDRSFLDACVTEVYELWNGKLERYTGNYSAYEKRRKEELAALIAAWEAQQEEIARIEEFINRFRYNESKASLVQSRIKQLEKIEPIIIPEGFKRMHFRLPEPPHCGSIALTLENIAKHYGEFCVIPSFSRIIDSGKKLALVGPNGAGKTTLMRIIAGYDKNFTGTLKYGTGVSIGFFSQDTIYALDDSKTVLDEAEADCPFDLIPEVRNLLGAFLFRGDDIYKKVSVLSGGERSRLALLKMLMHPANLLVLDEPTNHLDLDSKDILLEALKNYKGTVIFVSHDKFFLDSLAEEVLELSCGKEPRLYNGGYSYYLQKREQFAEIQTPVAIKQEDTLSTAQQYREQEKQKKAELRRLQRKESELLAEIDTTEQKIKALQAALARPENYSNPAKAKELHATIQETEKTLTELHTAWETVAEQLSHFEN